jgi:hypothetical protein
MPEAHKALKSFGCETHLQVLVNFRKKRDRFSDPSLWETALTLTPADWWETYRSLFPAPLSTPVTSAAAERAWSLIGRIDSKLSNRLTNERVEKLSFLEPHS